MSIIKYMLGLSVQSFNAISNLYNYGISTPLRQNVRVIWPVTRKIDIERKFFLRAHPKSVKVRQFNCFQKRLRNFSSENEGNVLISLGQYSRDQKTHTVALENGIYTQHTHVIDPLKFWQ
jgi:hypothetical protein